MDLRDEIIESQKARADLFKWKIILVAAIGAAALGLGETGPSVLVATGGHFVAAGEGPGTRQYLLCLVPLVCVYTDVLCAHINLRIRVIGQFLRLHGRSVPPPALGAVAAQTLTEDELNLKYEEFAHRARKMENKPRRHPILRFNLPHLLRRGRVSAFIFEDAALHFSSMLLSLFVFFWPFFGRPRWGWIAFFVAGSFGIAASLWALYEYNNRLRSLKHLAAAWP